MRHHPPVPVHHRHFHRFAAVARVRYRDATLLPDTPPVGKQEKGRQGRQERQVMSAKSCIVMARQVAWSETSPAPPLHTCGHGTEYLGKHFGSNLRPTLCYKPVKPRCGNAHGNSCCGAVGCTLPPPARTYMRAPAHPRAKSQPHASPEVVEGCPRERGAVLCCPPCGRPHCPFVPGPAFLRMHQPHSKPLQTSAESSQWHRCRRAAS